MNPKPQTDVARHARQVNYAPLSPISFLERAARTFPNRDAIVDGERRFSYREFHDRAVALAGGLRTCGIKPGDRVAFIAMNGEPLLTAHYGVPWSGGVLMAINVRLARPEIVHI